MIINTGCRTDIPAFYSKWLMILAAIILVDIYASIVMQMLIKVWLLIDI